MWSLYMHGSFAYRIGTSWDVMREIQSPRAAGIKVEVAVQGCNANTDIDTSGWRRRQTETMWVPTNVEG